MMLTAADAITFLAGGSTTSPRGWRAAAVACAMRYNGRADLALLVSDMPCAAAALFTTNSVKSAHIQYDQPLLTRNPGGIQAVMINSGSANACTGASGLTAAATTAQALETALKLPPDSAFVMSTGVIGLPLRVDKMLWGIEEGVPHLAPTYGPAIAQAIMTTDTYPKYAAVKVTLPNGGEITIGGMAKGSGMIHPNMATLLGVLTTDAAIAPATLDAALRQVADRSFHCISVDGDTSTNDTLLLLANGCAEQPMITDLDTPTGQLFLAGLTQLAQYLAREIARDGEGASRLVTIQVQGAVNDEAARLAAMNVARSPLVKTAVFGADPNWGRVVCALGYSEAQVDPQRLQLRFGDITVFAAGEPTEYDEQTVHQLLTQPEVLITADLGLGNGSATAWTCDFSYEYVRINAEYRS